MKLDVLTILSTPPKTGGSQVEHKRETDAELRARLINLYGMWGALASHILESSGAALDEIAEVHFQTQRR